MTRMISFPIKFKVIAMNGAPVTNDTIDNLSINNNNGLNPMVKTKPFFDTTPSKFRNCCHTMY